MCSHCPPVPSAAPQYTPVATPAPQYCLEPPSPPPPQAVTIITYKEPENPEYRPFVERLKEEALTHFNFTMRDGLVRSGDSGTGRGHGVGPGASVG